MSSAHDRKRIASCTREFASTNVTVTELSAQAQTHRMLHNTTYSLPRTSQNRFPLGLTSQFLIPLLTTTHLPVAPSPFGVIFGYEHANSMQRLPVHEHICLYSEDVCHYKGTFASTRGRLPVQRHVCWYGGTFASTQVYL